MDLNGLFANPELLQALATMTAAAVLLGITGIMVAFSTKEITIHLKSAWVTFRANLQVAIEAVDEPGDLVNVELDKLLDKITPANWNEYSAMFLPKFLRALADGLDRLAAPPQEVTITPPEVDRAIVGDIVRRELDALGRGIAVQPPAATNAVTTLPTPEEAKPLAP